MRSLVIREQSGVTSQESRDVWIRPVEPYPHRFGDNSSPVRIVQRRTTSAFSVHGTGTENGTREGGSTRSALPPARPRSTLILSILS